MSSLIKTAPSGRGARPDERKSPDKIRVWDVAIRLFHWSLLGCFIAAWITADEWDKAHELAGYAVAALVAFRLYWGFTGSQFARFRDFLFSPRQVILYLKDIRTGKARRYLGHNPAGSAMILALLACLIGLSISGYALTTDMFWGVEWVEETHEIIVNITLALAGLHVAGVAFSSIAHRENLVWAMITGRKRRHGNTSTG